MSPMWVSLSILRLGIWAPPTSCLEKYEFSFGMMPGRGLETTGGNETQ
jgi:hypothetical protein